MHSLKSTLPVFSFKNSQYGLICGGGHGIGLALSKYLLNLPELSHLWVTYRREEKAGELLALSNDFPNQLSLIELDPLNEKQLESTLLLIKNLTDHLDFCINSIGLLHDLNMQPERSLKDLNPEHLLREFMVNSAIFPLLAKHLKQVFKRRESGILVTLSAMVGSIGDNQLGGWYSYRASKAALNMLMKTVAIEYSRSHPHLSIQSIHPGTTNTELSQPFLKRVKHKVWTPEESAKNILDTIEKSYQEGTGLFKNWNGETIAW